MRTRCILPSNRTASLTKQVYIYLSDLDRVVDALALVVVEDHDRVVRRAARGPPRLGADVEEEARDPGAHGAKARVEELDLRDDGVSERRRL